MSKLTSRHIFTSESVGQGHPDKVCDQISDAILDACLEVDPDSHVACETAVGTNLCVNLGEITCKQWDKIDTQKIARQVVKNIGYDDPTEGFSYDTFNYVSSLHGQSPDINKGVESVILDQQGAGDQGMMFGYATNETNLFMPTPVVLSRRLLGTLNDLRIGGEPEYLRPDAKSQVSILYDKGEPEAITTVVISHQTRDVPIERIRKDIEEYARMVLEPTRLVTNDTVFLINPTGRFVIGGPAGDSGLTGRKIIVDTYGGVGSHGGGAFSGKDPSKVDRSAAYYARYVAKNIVASGIADKCELQVSYAIGVAKPTSINVCTFGTGKKPDEAISEMASRMFDFRPGCFIQELGLIKARRDWCYLDTAKFGHFGWERAFPWEYIDRANDIKEYFAHR